ncbi:hydroperoxide isomerase ALOXE3-like [Diretmus argenteus]
MGKYTLQVTTGNMLHAGTFDHLYVTLIGAERQSERTELTNCGLDFKIGQPQTGTYTVTTCFSLGFLLLLKLEMDPDHKFPENEWYCSKMVVKTPEDDSILFPCYRWLSKGELVVLRGGREYVSEHWKDDGLFGYQFLNGVNPTVIQRCLELPSNFPVTEEMVKPFLANGSSLAKGNIFICDYKKMEGLPTKCIDGNPVPLSAALCLLYMSPEKKLMPIAIQLGQQPSEKNPIFLPSDSESDWLLAKIFVRNADVLLHAFTSLEMEGSTELWRRALSETTYSSLCLPENIAARGLESIPNFYYRDDGLKLWAIINSFVKAVVAYYYPSDSEVSLDSELQQWLNEIFTYGFLGNSNSGIPESFQTVEQVIKFITMVIYTSSAHHAAVHNGQFDYESWIPNAPMILQKAPPTAKGQSSMETILETLPNKATGAFFMSVAWLLTKKYHDFIPLGTYPDEHFDEAAAKQMIKDFQAELSSLSEAIAKRNAELELPYEYLNPTHIENSVTI